VLFYFFLGMVILTDFLVAVDVGDVDLGLVPMRLVVLLFLLAVDFFLPQLEHAIFFVYYIIL